MLGFQAALPPLGIVPTSYFAFPYIVAFMAVLIAVLLLLVKLPSFRKYRRKRYILIYFVVALTLILLVYQIDFLTRTAVGTYSIDTSIDRFYLGEINDNSVHCNNSGFRACSFNIVISVDASFSAQTPQTCLEFSNMVVKIPFLLQERWSSMNGDSKPVFFTIDENVTGFSFRLSLEAHAFNSIPVRSSPVYAIACVWNATEDCYELDVIGGFAA